MTMRRLRTRIATGLLVSAALARPALGQPALSIESAPTRGVYHPGLGVADDSERAGAASVLVNPAGLGGLGGYDVGLRHTETGSDVPWSGRGTALYGALSLPAPRFVSWLGNFKVGGAVEVLRPPGPDSAVTGKVTLALAYRATSWLSLGLGYAHLFAPDTTADRIDTVDVGARLRLGRRFALGLLVQDLGAPALADGSRALERVYGGELLARPLGTGRLELGLGARFGERQRDVEPRLRLWFHPVAGLGFGAEATLRLHAEQAPDVWRVAAGLAIDLGRWGGTVSGLFGSPLQPTVGDPGGSLALRLSELRRQTFAERVHTTRPLVEVKLDGPSYVGWLRLLEQLQKLEGRHDLAGLLLTLEAGIPEGWAGADELRDALMRLRRGGLRIFTYSRDYSSRDYYVATAAERIYLHPGGSLPSLGIARSHIYLRDLLDKLGMRAEFFYLGAYKTAHEVFSRSAPSAESAEQEQALLDAQYQALQRAIAEGRHLTLERAAAALDRGPLTPPRAIDAQLVDGLVTREELDKLLEKELGRKVRITALDTLVRRGDFPTRQIAVIPIRGVLTSTASAPDGSTSSKSVSQLLRTASADRNVRAIVLRVNSEGGASLAGEEIHQAVIAARKLKPVLCSFGGLAASAAYHLSAPCDRIYTRPNTITGSIGTFVPRVDLTGLLDRLGVRVTTWLRGQNADVRYGDLGLPLLGVAGLRPMTAAQREMLMEILRHHYDRFVADVAAGRRMRQDQADRVARGRVWTGESAVSHGLADELGGFMDTVAEARRRGHISDGDDYELRYLWMRGPSLLESLVGLPLSQADAGAPDEAPPRPTGPLAELAQFMDGEALPLLLLLLRGEPLHLHLLPEPPTG